MFGTLCADFTYIAADFWQPVLHRPVHPIKLARFGALTAPPAALLARLWTTDKGRALFAGVAAHALRPFSAPMSSAIGVTLGTAAHKYGWPVAEGGSQAISDAMIAAAMLHRVKFETGRHIRSLDELDGADVVMLDITPRAAAEICGSRMPRRIARSLGRYRHGPGTFKVDFAVQDGVPWTYEPSRRAGTVHLGGTFAQIAAAEKAVSRGQMPDSPYVLVCQQYLADPTRSAGDVHPLYAYAHVPAGWTGDATEHIIGQIERFAPGFRERILAQHVRSVPAMQAYNVNYIGGDVVTGANSLRQLVFRPRPALNPYSLGIPGVYVCSAATPPGAGAHGMCGYNAAQSALTRLGAGAPQPTATERSDLDPAGLAACCGSSSPPTRPASSPAAASTTTQPCEETHHAERRPNQ